MIQTILFATDMGIYTSYLLQHVNTIALKHRARVTVLHVVEPAGQLGDAVVSAYLSYETRQELEHEGLGRIIDMVRYRILDSLEAEFIDGQEGLSFIQDVRVVAGKPSDLILEEAHRCQADMIILGSHGEHTVSPNILGSVTSRVLQMSRIPVYMVPLARQIGYQAKAS